MYNLGFYNLPRLSGVGEKAQRLKHLLLKFENLSLISGTHVNGEARVATL